MFYPLKFYPVYKDYIWGGNSFEKFGRKLPGKIIAESWDVSCHKNGESIVSNGQYEGNTLRSLIDKYGTSIVGSKISYRSKTAFPLLIKLIDANDTLSIQVHPDDKYARENENGEMGKNEMWYVIHAEPGAKIYRGLKEGLSKEAVRTAINEGKLLHCLKEFPVSPGDAIYVDAGTIHAIGKGIVIAEIQQNSDVTYRLYDFDRVDFTGKPRALHIDRALDVLNYTCKSCSDKIPGLYDSINSSDRIKYLISNEYFTVEHLDVVNGFDHVTSNDRFYIYTLIDGQGVITADNNKTFINAGETVLIPAGLSRYAIEGKFKALRTYMSLYRNELREILLERGFTEGQIREGIAGYEMEFE